MKLYINLIEGNKIKEEFGEFNLEFKPAVGDYIVIHKETYIVYECVMVKTDSMEYDDMFYFFINVKETTHKIEIEND